MHRRTDPSTFEQFFCRKWSRIIHEMGSTRKDQNMFLFRRMKERVRGDEALWASITLTKFSTLACCVCVQQEKSKAAVKRASLNSNTRPEPVSSSLPLAPRSDVRAESLIPRAQHRKKIISVRKFSVSDFFLQKWFCSLGGEKNFTVIKNFKVSKNFILRFEWNTFWPKCRKFLTRTLPGFADSSKTLVTLKVTPWVTRGTSSTSRSFIRR